jgi:Fe-S oxidoreductase
MTLSELTSMMEEVIREDQKDPTPFRPIVAIGHTKDLTDLETVEAFLNYLKENGIAVTTFGGAYHRCRQ